MKITIVILISLLVLHSCKTKPTIYNLSLLPNGIDITIKREIFNGARYFYQINYEIVNNTKDTIDNLKIDGIMYLEGKGYQLSSGGSRKYETKFAPGSKANGRFNAYMIRTKPDSIVLMHRAFPTFNPPNEIE